MKKYLTLLLFLFFAFFWAPKVQALDYSISSYKGDLVLHSDNTASYTEVVTYHFDDPYNGQVVTLGHAGKMPTGFTIDSNPSVSALTNGQPASNVSSQVRDLGDGYEVKIYNSGSSGDTVQVTVTWQLRNLLFMHQDIAELNWTPVSDWDETIEKLEFRIHGLDDVDRTALYPHTGYFGQAVKLEQDGSSYQLELNNLSSGKRLELHAYWDRSVFNQVEAGQISPQDYLGKFQAIERGIAWQTAFWHQVLEIYLPLVLALALLVSFFFYHRFKKSIELLKKYPKDARLYEAPQNLAPLVLASNIYSIDLDEVAPTMGARGALRFENMVQATLLDLVDRRKLSISGQGDNPVIQVISTENLTEAEAYFLEMAMGKQTEVRVKDLFFNYQISEDLYKGRKKKADEAEIRRIGNQMSSRFKDSLRSVSKKVAAESQALNLPDNYRSLTDLERKLLFWAQALSAFAIFATIAIILLFIFVFSTFYWPYLIIISLGLWQSIVYLEKADIYRRDGVLTEEGAERYHLWSSFSNMLRDIAKLDKTEIDGLILWNRLLVYATLFGYAERVSKLMRWRQIQLENPAMNGYVYNNWHHVFWVSSQTFSNYGQVASTASHFSVSSGGSSGGGFSGGGGGGGGGAF
ncbi:DUF2207 domain-containing protein [Streptococcus oricebi]|uniref:DUF2207 domain-containing protein n=1 Tax=Streptococcus oricebi TaxID=1547447 RepID=A0ABS5B5Q1_9STRE|nr:DUF2207 domain-containing protein [Streptococcus oricebi]MBP2624080.1 DUF2207 domain-containing protein [Streptococcus oricebi]